MPRAKKDAADKAPVAGTTEAKVKALSSPYPEPPPHCKLRADDRPFFDAVVRARMAYEWSASDLIHAVNLARCMADIERNTRLLESEGDVLQNARGTQIMNPRFTVLEQSARRSMALTRILQLHAAPAKGPVRDQEAHRGEVVEANKAMEAMEDDDLLARPGYQH